MHIQVETDNHIDGRQQLTAHVESVIRDAVDRYPDHVTHVEAHLGNASGAEKTGSEGMRCLLEARVTGIKNLAVSHQSETLHLAIKGAADKLKHALDSSIGKLQDRQRRAEGAGHASADVVAQDPEAA
jgi:ribosome-associated translation inhibitor RaiA